MNAEWDQILADDQEPARRDLLRGWAVRYPALSGRAGLGELVDAVTRHGDDEVLKGLLDLARAGEELAGRAALQAMLGAAVRLARRTVVYAGGDLEEATSRAVAALWQVVREYPVERRSCRAADGVSLDVLNLLTGAGRGRPREVAAGLPAEVADGCTAPVAGDDDGLRSDFWAAARLPASADCSDEQLVLLLAWGVRTSAVSAADARLLLTLHSPADPTANVTCREVAHDLGLGHAAVRQRVSRATRRLAAAVHALALGTVVAHEQAA
jgi:hypothetical protein